MTHKQYMVSKRMTRTRSWPVKPTLYRQLSSASFVGFSYYIKYNLSNCKAWVDFVILFCRYNLKIKKSKKEMHFARVTAGNYEQFALKHCWIRNTVITHLFAQLTLGIRLNDSASFRLSWHMKDGGMGFCLLFSFLLFFIGISTAQMAYIIGSDAGNKTQAKRWLNIQATSKLLDFKVAL